MRNSALVKGDILYLQAWPITLRTAQSASRIATPFSLFAIGHLFRTTSAHQGTYGKHPSNPAACDYRPRDQARLGSRSLPPPSSSPLAARKLAKGLTGSFRATLPQSMSVHRQRHHRRGRGRGAEAPHPLPLQGAHKKRGLSICWSISRGVSEWRCARSTRQR